jgi:hypothetical protein
MRRCNKLGADLTPPWPVPLRAMVCGRFDWYLASNGLLSLLRNQFTGCGPAPHPAGGQWWHVLSLSSTKLFVPYCTKGIFVEVGMDKNKLYKSGSFPKDTLLTGICRS